MKLEAELKSLLEKSMSRIPKETAAIMAASREELQNLNLTDHSKRRGDRAPDFELTDATGEIISMGALLSKGPVVISFYRGSW